MKPEQQNGTGPLAGIKVVDVSSAVAGPWASSWLAEQGADVIFIEKVGVPDVMRMTGAVNGDQSGCWVSMHRNKRGMDLDIRDEAGREILMKLVVEADVFIQNFRPGVVERLAIDYSNLSKINPDLVYLSVSGFGADGPYADRPVYDPIIQAMSGMTEAQNGTYVKAVVADKTTAMAGANAVLAALVARANGAGGQHVNTTDSAVRITHLPTNIVVQCQNERSQHKNKETCFKMLKARLYKHELQKKEKETENLSESKTDIGWGHQIRSYVLHPYRMVKDNRTNYENSNPDKVLDGDIDVFLENSLYKLNA